MIEYERAFTVDLTTVSPYAMGSVRGVCTLTDYYMDAVPLGGIGPREDWPVCRVRLTTDATGEHMEITVKTPTADPNARTEHTWPVAAGSFRCSADVPRVSKTRYRMHTLRRVLVSVIGGRITLGAPAPSALPELAIPDTVVCTLDVFSHPAGLPPVLELEGPQPDVDALVAELAGVPWLVARDKSTVSTLSLARAAL